MSFTLADPAVLLLLIVAIILLALPQVPQTRLLGAVMLIVVLAVVFLNGRV